MVKIDAQPFLEAIVKGLEADAKAKTWGSRFVGNGWWYNNDNKELEWDFGATRIGIETLRSGTITFVDGKLHVRRKPDGTWLVRNGRRGPYQEIEW